jgi:hypothetical protein
MKKSYFITTLLIYILEYCCITLIYDIVLFLNILFKYNPLFTYTSSNILLLSGIIFSVFLGPDEHLQVFECPVAVWSVASEDRLSSQHHGGYVFLTANKSRN